MTDEATAVVPRGPPIGDGIFDGSLDLFGQRERTRGQSDDMLDPTNMTVAAMANQQIEEVIAGLDMDKLKQNLLDDFLTKFKGQLVDKSTRMDNVKQRGRDGESLTEPSDLKPIPNTSLRRQKYQATVEDDNEDMPHQDKAKLQPQAADDRPHLHITTQDPGSPHSSVVSMNSSQSSALGSPGSLDSDGMMSPYSARPRLRVRFSDRPSPVVVHRPGESPPQQPQALVREPVSPESAQASVLSALDLKWGRLFSQRGEPTTKLDQVLRGLANYLIAEYSPRNSMVLSPDKLNTFYRNYNVESEHIDFSRMFDYRTTRDLNSLSHLYESLKCDFHLIQDKPGRTPDVPALTPAGFATWFTTLIQAFPDHEATRLTAIVADLPFEAEVTDSDSERVPRQLSRHLLPDSRVDRSYMALADAVLSWRRNMGLSEASATSPRAVEIEVSRRRDDKPYRENGRKTSSKDESSRRYSRPAPLPRHQRQEEALAPPGVGRHARPQKSLTSDSRYRREIPRSMSDGAASYAVMSARTEGADSQRRTRGDAYQLARGRNRWNSLDNMSRGGTDGAGGGGSAAAANRRRSMVVAASQVDNNPTYEEFLAAGQGGGYSP